MTVNVMHEVELPVFRGPLDLLLHLVEKRELDITAVSLVAVTDQYLAIIRAKEQIDLSSLSEFIAIGSRLLLIKSRALLPQQEVPAGEEPAPDEDAEELAELLRQYREFKRVAAEFRDRQAQGLRSYPRLAPPPKLPPALGLGSVTMDQLLRALEDALSHRDEAPRPVAVIVRDPVTIRQRSDDLIWMLAGGGPVSFRAFITSCKRPVEIVVSFLALLELLKAGRVFAEQNHLFGDIEIHAAQPALALS